MAVVFFAVDEGFVVDRSVGQFAHVDEIDFVSPLSFQIEDVFKGVPVTYIEELAVDFFAKFAAEGLGAVFAEFYAAA